MIKYIAKTEIGGYTIGSEVPEEKAIHWNWQYKYPPCEKITLQDDIPKKIEQPKVIEINKEVKLPNKNKR
jgi:hypothetical protein